jgi:hypothetical protein
LAELLSPGGGFLVYEKKINPGIAATFPWLNKVANAFERYRFKSMSIEYIPTSSALQQGSVWMLPVFDTEAPPPTSLLNVMSAMRGTTSNAWAPWKVTIPMKSCHLGASPEGYKKVRDDLVTGDNQGYDYLKLYFGANGVTSAETIGYFKISYNVELQDPITGSQAATEIVATESTQFAISDTTVAPLTQVYAGIANVAKNNALGWIKGTDGAGDYVECPIDGRYRVEYDLQAEGDDNKNVTASACLAFDGTPDALTISDFNGSSIAAGIVTAGQVLWNGVRALEKGAKIYALLGNIASASTSHFKRGRLMITPA